MKVEIQQLPKYGRKILFEIEAEKVKEKKTEIVREIQKSAEIPGFRKGKVPEHVIESRYSDVIKKNVLERIITDSYLAAVKEHNLSPVIDPEVADVKFDDTISFSVYVEIKPEVSVKKYKELVVKEVSPEPVTEQMVDEVLADWEKRKEFASSIIDPEKRAAWRKKIREQLEQLNQHRAKTQEEQQIWDQLFKNSSVEIPEKLMLQRARYLTREQFNYIDTQNKTKEEIEKIAEEIFEKMKPVAEEKLKKYFILEKIAEIENVQVTEEEVEQAIKQIVMTSGEDYQQVKKRLTDSGKIHDLKDDIKIEKTFELIKNSAQTIKKIILPGEEKHEHKKPKF
ncbi:MAG: trigger factor [Candidatus Ratteibacteria bacterium]